MRKQAITAFMKRFNVRVYGLLIDNGRVLVSDEHINGTNMTKFPGGGLEFGESTRQCLVREFMEELNLRVDVLSHYYTTDFFVQSAFDANSQIISVYYLVCALEPIGVKIAQAPFEFTVKEGAQAFRWIDCSQISGNDFTFAIDKHVGDMLGRISVSPVQALPPFD